MSKRTLVLGASTNPVRYSNRAIHRLQAAAHEVEAIGGRADQVGAIPIQIGTPNLEGIDTITLYLNPQRQKSYYDYILSLKPKRVIFNPGTENAELVKLLKEANIEVEIACTLVMLATGEY